MGLSHTNNALSNVARGAGAVLIKRGAAKLGSPRQSDVRGIFTRELKAPCQQLCNKALLEGEKLVFSLPLWDSSPDDWPLFLVKASYARNRKVKGPREKASRIKRRAGGLFLRICAATEKRQRQMKVLLGAWSPGAQVILRTSKSKTSRPVKRNRAEESPFFAASGVQQSLGWQRAASLDYSAESLCDVENMRASKKARDCSLALMFMVETMGFEPTTSGLQSPRSPSWAMSPKAEAIVTEIDR
jgi:hypothetical protein